ncbi:type IV secretory pathway VirB10-like protein [Mycobacterium sp. MAA66]|uniref:MmpS family transport accessory protein n=1 Tax=Mycobacterium sp. MAA66 TaxID=3156297 RepID=UPI003512D4B9
MSGSQSEEPGSGESAPEVSATGETEIYSQAYSAPEAEHFTSGPYVPPEPGLYDYDSYEAGAADAPTGPPPRWPWVVGVVAIVAAVSLVAAVALLVTKHPSSETVATPPSTSTPTTPFQDEFTTTTPPPPPPPTTTEPPPPPSTVTVTQPPPPPPTTEAPPPPPSTTAAAAPPAPPTTSTTQAGPKYVTYQVWGTKAPLDRISVTYTDASGHQRTQQNVYIPWTLTVTPISMSDVGSVQASSLLRLSHLNCSITTSDGQTITSQQNNDWQTSC